MECLSMIISEKQIMKLITIANTHAANLHIIHELKACEDIQNLLKEINDQQCDELKEIA